MTDGVLLDTSFLRTFVDRTRKNHAVAVQFYRHFVDEKKIMYLSTIVASEFSLVQPVTDLLLDQMLILPFNLDDATAAAELNFTQYKGTPGLQRDALKDDFKLLGQAKARRIGFIITDDSGTLFRFCEELRKKGQLPTRGIKLDDGFSASFADTIRADSKAQQVTQTAFIDQLESDLAAAPLAESSPEEPARPAPAEEKPAQPAAAENATTPPVAKVPSDETAEPANNGTDVPASAEAASTPQAAAITEADSAESVTSERAPPKATS